MNTPGPMTYRKIIEIVQEDPEKPNPPSQEFLNYLVTKTAKLIWNSIPPAHITAIKKVISIAIENEHPDKAIIDFFSSLLACDPSRLMNSKFFIETFANIGMELTLYILNCIESDQLKPENIPARTLADFRNVGEYFFQEVLPEIKNPPPKPIGLLSEDDIKAMLDD